MGGSSLLHKVGYKYHLGAHLPFCHGPIDKVTRIRVAENIAWEGESTGGSIVINEPGLFGGEDSEGGVSGTVDFDFGGPAQTVNTYLQSKQEDDIPAYRGVAAAVLNQVYLGTNPYLKPWEFRAQRIHTSTRGAVQWYDSKAEVPGESGDVVSSWDFSDVTFDSQSATSSALSSESIWVSDDETKMFSVVREGLGGRIYSWEMSSPGDLSSLSQTGSVAAS
jgi:hypothetical protein